MPLRVSDSPPTWPMDFMNRFPHQVYLFTAVSVSLASLVSSLRSGNLPLFPSSPPLTAGVQHSDPRPSQQPHPGKADQELRVCGVPGPSGEP